MALVVELALRGLPRSTRGRNTLLRFFRKYSGQQWGFIWERAQRRAEQFAKRVIPVVLEDAGIGSLTGRLKCVQYWQNELKALDDQVRDIGPVDCGQSTTQQLQDIKTFTVHLADALNTFSDRVMPRPPALSAAQFAPVVELVKKRCGL